jgi:Na+-driven multidrug efflux pump
MSEGGKNFQTELIKIAVPVTLQSLMQSSFSVVDQIMTGQLGSVSIAGIGIGGKFASIYSVVIAAVASVAGIMIAQFVGKNDTKEVGRSFYTNLVGILDVSGIFCYIKCSHSI